MDKRRFKVGDWVRVKAQVTADYRSSLRIMRREPVDAVGQVVGISRVYEGHVVQDYEYGNCFESGGFRPVWLVRQGMENVPLKVLDEDIGTTLVVWDRKLPIRYCDTSSVRNDRYREEMRRVMKDWPRDSQGRWTKGGA